ncbi:acyl-CoA dehydrogenase family protein [Hyphomonas adhaerens]|uniref:acyl-CoA dehydrogenase family protein n=1 Tax=Hyphomonas adhaerens TaxID=81029 RepID=UPI002357877F|nr:acyl-CoA dehydrogenase family protein [Hyphomonas adhaerens]|tara:strand:+ start:60577 stop:61623 length:1047 start_codon:yes stop_codon:yes gene_type:complete
MEFALSEDQRMLQDSISGFLKDNASLDTIRKIADDDAEAKATLAAGLSEMGIMGLHVPEAAGGSGLGLLEACLVQEALGYAVTPSGFLAATVAAHVLPNAGEAYAEGVATGDMVFGLSLTELSSRRDLAGLTLKDGHVSGKTLLAMVPDRATHVLTADTDGGLHVVDTWSATAMRTIDRTRTFQELGFDHAKCEASMAQAAGALEAARLLIAADTLGAAQAMLDKAVEYAKERKQFGRVIGSFQAVKHLCAEMTAKLEPARALVWHAAYAMDTGDPEAAVMANLAKAHLAEVGTFVAKTSTEVHGGMGFTDLLGLHYWFKRIGVNRQLFGSPEQARHSAAELQGFVAA